MRLLLVEDDAMIGESLEEGLRAERYAIDWVRDGRSAELALDANTYDLILLDLGLPRQSGFDVLDRYRRRNGDAPILIISARDDKLSRLKGLDSGADDYLIKPFDFDELCSRVRALLRRRSGKTVLRLSFGALEIDAVRHVAFFQGEPLELTVRQFALLQLLIEAGGEVVTRERLLQRMYDWGDDVGSNTIEVFIHQLRRKLGAGSILTVRGIGYRLASPT